jgi:hypothetical protein
MAAGETLACGSRPPRSHLAILWASIVSFFAVPPWIAFLERAGPRPKGSPSGAHRSASQSQVKRHATATTIASREGALALRKVAGLACLCRCSMIAPSWFRRQTSMLRACRSRPQYNGCGAWEKRLRAPPFLRDHSPTTSIPPRYAEEGASISIKRLQATADSARSCLASASRRA